MITNPRGGTMTLLTGESMSGKSQKDKGFAGLCVAAFESRMAVEMGRLITHHGGQPLLAPTMRELPLDENHEALAFGDRLLAGEFDMLILMTGVGTRTLVATLETRHPRERILAAFRKVRRVCRGPKPVAALKSLGLEPGLTVPEPNTWEEILGTLDEKEPVRGLRVAVQEYGISNLALLQGLRERGAEVTRVPVYRWTLPEDLTPLQNTLREIEAGHVSVALFTNANQVDNVMQVARDMGLLEETRAGLSRAVVASVGPICSQSLAHHGMAADLEPPHPKMGPLVKEASLRCHGILAGKGAGGSPPAGRSPSGGGSGPRAIGPTSWSPAPSSQVAHKAASTATAVALVTHPAAENDPVRDSPFMRACRREPTSVTPIWLMRQAGRYQREYREIRARRSFLDVCRDPDLVTQITVYAVERLEVDAAIIFADLLLPLPGMGLNLAYNKGEGPSIDPPLRTAAGVDRLREPDVHESVGYLFEALRRTRRALPAGIPLLGFAGAPFTLASYMIEGGGSSHYVHTKAFLSADPGAWNALLERITRVTIKYLNAQIAAGADAVQLFDTWVGCLSRAEYIEHVLPHTRRVIDAITPGVPIIHFGTQTAHLLPEFGQTGAGVVGLDWRVDLVETWDRLGDVAVQGNLDPTVLFAPRPVVRERARELLHRVGGRPGHIFNLGHGILPRTPLDNVRALIDTVHEWGGA